MITLLRKLFWLGLFLLFTLGFVTLFDHGYQNTKQFTTDARGEVSDLIKLAKDSSKPSKPADAKKPAQP